MRSVHWPGPILPNAPRTAAVPVSIALVSAAVIAFQIVIMQILSVMQWHHFAAMVISMALLGFGAAGTLLSLWRDGLERRYATALPSLYLLTAVFMVLATRIATGAAEFDTFLLFFDPRQIGLLGLTYLVFAIPFFTAGLAITLAFICEVDRVDRLYFANLGGSGLGALLIVLLLFALPLEYLASVLALLPLAAGWIARPRRLPGRWLRVAGVLVFVACAGAVLTGFYEPVALGPSQYKDISAALRLPGARIIHRSDGPHGRMEVVQADALRIDVGLSLHHQEQPPVRNVMFANGDYYGTLLGYDQHPDHHLLDSTTQALPYELRKPDRVLVLNAATGVAVSHALARGASRVTAVEPNRQANRLLVDVSPEWIEWLYRDPRVEMQEESARTYLSRGDEDAYDLIVTETLGAFGGETGVASLAEQYHLTTEAFLGMWDQLSADGMIATTVWVDSPPRAVLRLLATWRRVLDARGLAHPDRHIAAVRSWATITLVLSHEPFVPADLSAVRALSARLGFDPLVMRGITRTERTRFNRLPDEKLFELVDALVSGDMEAVRGRYLFDVAPVSDDQPFFSRFLPVSSIPELARLHGITTVPYLELGTVLGGVTAVQIVAAALLLVIAPLARVGWKASGRGWTFLTFAGLGVGFMFFEIVLIQQLVLYLGQPVYATAVVLAVLLIASGGGSLLSRRIAKYPGAMTLVGLAIAVVIGGYAVGLMPVIRATITLPLLVRVPVVFLLLAIPGVPMGMMFPLGLGRLARRDRSHIPWACAIDSALSVSAAAIATLVALGGGFRLVLIIAAAAYAVAALASIRLGRRPRRRGAIRRTRRSGLPRRSAERVPS